MSGRIRLLLAACGWLCAVACQAAPDFAAEPASADARYAAAWVLAGADHHERPFAVVDKHDARIYVFEADGRLVGASAVLLGVAPGDFSAGAGRAPSSLSPAERTTPAGRFAALPGRNDKGEDIVVIDLTGKSDIADFMVIASGRSTRQVASMADHLRERIKQAGHPAPRVEGLTQGDWVLVDAGDVVVHVFRPEVRDFYNLEKMWTPGRTAAKQAN